MTHDKVIEFLACHRHNSPKKLVCTRLNESRLSNISSFFFSVGGKVGKRKRKMEKRQEAFAKAESAATPESVLS